MQRLFSMKCLFLISKIIEGLKTPSDVRFSKRLTNVSHVQDGQDMGNEDGAYKSL
jgi:hypothetical protein